MTGSKQHSSSCEEYGFLPPAQRSSRLYGQSNAERSFLRAWQRGLAPHAWLLYGTRGIGKASFAYAATRFLLNNEQSDEQKGQARDLSSDASAAVFQQVAAGTHPDLIALTAIGEGEITVDQARSLVSFLHKTPMLSRYRVGIVDSADRLNREAANALLKVVEEPGRRVVLFLICHASAALPSTLRSRCRPLPFRSVGLDLIIEFLCERGAERAVAERVARLSSGSFYYAGLLCEAGGEAFARAFGEALSARLTNAQEAKLGNIEKSERLLEFLLRDAVAPEAFRFLWQQFLSCAVRAGLSKKEATVARKHESGDDLMDALLGLLSTRARKILECSKADDWQRLWQSSVPNLLASRSARGGDFALAADFALAGLGEIR